jgi:alkanesulfonate monooxygenase SsuD/methylene tetrahydromethanopterin reductase-like flavin-dependent oxidoreductase (luciferase family)
MFRREYGPETLPAFARKAEAAGFDELWVVEDCFYTSGIAAAATALAVTESITIGLGIMPAVVRNPVFTAMEIATLCRLFPGRFSPGIGHGVAEWMRQIGAMPKSQLTALEEVTFTVGELLAEKEVSLDGQYVHLEGAKLVHPPAVAPPVSLGVICPKSLQLAGRAAGGTILSEFSSPAYVAWAKEQIEQGRTEAGRTDPHRLTLFTFAAAAPTTDSARARVRPLVAEAIASGDIDPKLAPLGILEEARRMTKRGGRAGVEAEMPDEWVDRMTIVGTPRDWQAAMERLVAGGVHSVILTPLPDAPLDEIDAFAAHVREIAG